MIDQLPENRTLPDDVRMRARRRVSEGMNPAARTGRPILIAAGVSMLAAGAVFSAQVLYGGNAEIAGPAHQYNGELVGKDRNIVNHVEPGKVDPDALARCGAAAKAHPPVAEWQTVATSHKNGTVLTAFRAPSGVFFCANTATTTTISEPDPAEVSAGRGQVKILFTTPTGALAGLVSPDVKILGLHRIGGIEEQGRDNAGPGIVDGLFLAPAGFTKAENGTMALANGNEFAVRGVPKATASVVDRPLPPADRGTPDAQKFAECLRDRPVPDADQFAHTLTVRLSATSTVRLGRFGDLLLYCMDSGEPVHGSVFDIEDLDEVRGTTVASLAGFYDFKVRKGDEPGEVAHTSSSTFAAAGLVTDPRVASITYTRPGMADVPASLGNGTFVLAAPLIDRHPDSRVVVRDASGTVLETIKQKDVP